MLNLESKKIQYSLQFVRLLKKTYDSLSYTNAKITQKIVLRIFNWLRNPQNRLTIYAIVKGYLFGLCRLQNIFPLAWDVFQAKAVFRTLGKVNFEPLIK